MYMVIVFNDDKTEKVFCAEGRYNVSEGVLHICHNYYTNEWVHYPLLNIRRYGLEAQ